MFTSFQSRQLKKGICRQLFIHRLRKSLASLSAHLVAQKKQEVRADRDSSFEVRRASSASPDGIAIVFSSVHSRGFSFYKQFEDFGDKFHRIYVRDRRDLWYTEGISPETNSFESLMDLLSRSIGELGRALPVLFFGSSMGGYAALLAQQYLRVGFALATSPQTVLDGRLPHTPRQAVAERFRDIALTLSKDAQPRSVLFGAQDFVDIYNVSRVPGLMSSAVALAGEDHLAAAHLVSSGAYKKIIAALPSMRDLSPRAISTAANLQVDQRCFEPGNIALITEIVECVYLGRSGDAAALVRKLTSIDDHWADAYGVLATLETRKGNFVAAAQHARHARERAPKSITLATQLATTLRLAGFLEEAEEAYLTCLELRPRHYSALCGLAETLLDLGRVDDAKLRLHEAMASHPNPRNAELLLKKIDLTE